MKSIFIIFVIFLTSIKLNAQVDTKTFFYDKNQAVPREHNLDILHVLINISFDPPKGMVSGKVIHTFVPLQNHVDSIFFDAPSINIKKAILDGKTEKFAVSPKGVTIYPGTPLLWDSRHQVEIQYEAQPKVGLYFIGWNDTLNKSRKQIWTQGQAYDNRYWVPIYDQQNDKATTEMIVTFDAAYKVLSNGDKLNEKVNKDGTKTWHYKLEKPHATYLIMLGIGKYEIEKRKSKSGVPLQLWYYPEYPERVEWTYKYSTDMVDWMEKELGVKYPWNSYSQIPVQDYTFGAMENTTATLFGDFYFVDEGAYLDRAYLYVNAHELTHQWFGDYITERTETHHWLQESFATYYGNLYTGIARGQDYYEWSRKTAIDQALDASRKDNFPVASSVGGTVRHYPKGAVILDMLRYTVGEEAFRRAIKYYLDKHPYSNVDTEDLLIAFHEKLGLSLDWFWEQWIYRGGEPKYELSFREISSGGNQKVNEFKVTQVHETNDLIHYFKMPFIFEVHYKDGTIATKKEWIEKYQHIVQLPNSEGKEIDYVLFDPNQKVMKSATFKKPLNYLLSQAVKSSNMLDRYEAWIALKTTPMQEKIAAMEKGFEQEKFYAVKGEIIAQAASEQNERTLAIIRKALNDTDVDVRKSVLANLKPIPETLLQEYEKLLQDKSYQIVEQVLERLTTQFPQNKSKYLEITKNTVGTRGNNVRIKWLEIAAFSGEEQHKRTLATMVGSSSEFLTRIAAMNSLKKLNYLDHGATAGLFDAALNANSKLSTEGLNTLKYFYNQLAFRKTIEDFYKSKAWKSSERETLNKLFL